MNYQTTLTKLPRNVPRTGPQCPKSIKTSDSSSTFKYQVPFNVLIIIAIQRITLFLRIDDVVRLKAVSQKANIKICVFSALSHLQMQQLERQVIDAERQAEKAFQQVEYHLIFACLCVYKDCLVSFNLYLSLCI